MDTDTVRSPAGDEAADRRREQRGWYFYDWAGSAYSTSVLTVFLGPCLTSVAEAAADADGFVHPLGIPVRAGSFFAYAVSLSVIVAVLVMPLVGAAADRTGRKMPLLAAAAYTGAAATTGMFLLDGERYLLGGLLLVVANAAQSVAMMLYNAYLPQIAPPEERDAVSSRGGAFGYAAGALVLVLNLVLCTGHDSFGVSEGMAVRICLASAGLWWGGLRPGAAAPAARPPCPRAGGGPAGFPATRGHRPRHAPPPADPRLPAGVPGLQRRHPDRDLAGLGIRLQGAGARAVDAHRGRAPGPGTGGGGGALALGRTARRYGAKRTILGSLVAWTVTLAAGYFLPAGAPVWFFVLAAGIGLVLGGSQALSRSLFSHLVPPGKEAEYYSAYEMSDRGMSWLGPLLFGLTYQLTGSYRDAIVSLVGFFVLGFVLLARVPVRRAISDAGNPVPQRI